MSYDITLYAIIILYHVISHRRELLYYTKCNYYIILNIKTFLHVRKDPQSDF